ncbi:hypothetical protein O3M35_004932 [Rhynocoris fuscipes]|uniref:Dipeptidase n=1 Tax=Rhynocoris fuscipes TaxID=488301 RepID=A0AAW1DG97_9HEMI
MKIRHNDLPWNIRKFVHNRLNEFRFGEDLRGVPPWSLSAWSHTDLQRLKAGQVSAQVKEVHNRSDGFAVEWLDGQPPLFRQDKEEVK